jgi:hypothetical protein
MQRTYILTEKDPKQANIAALIKDDERNILAFKELANYNATGSFLFIHPLTLQHKQTDSLDRLRKADPARFSKELINADKNITRYRSLLKNRKYKDKEERLAWENHIAKFLAKKEIMARLLSS